MKKLDDANNLFYNTDYTFCKNLVCKKYNSCVRAVTNYKFEKNDYIGVFTFGNKETPYFKEISMCNNYIEKDYEESK